MSDYFQTNIEKKIEEDLCFEHSQHKPPYWRLMNKCSECWKAHYEVKNRQGSFGTISNLDYLQERSAHPNQKYW